MASKIPQDLIQKLMALDHAATSGLPGTLSGGTLQLPRSIPVLEQLQALQNSLDVVQSPPHTRQAPALPQHMPWPGGQPGPTGSLSLPGAPETQDLTAVASDHARPSVPGSLAALPLPPQRHLALPTPDQFREPTAPLPALPTLFAAPAQTNSPTQTPALPRATSFSAPIVANVSGNQLSTPAAWQLGNALSDGARPGFPAGSGSPLPRSLPGQLSPSQNVNPATGPLVTEAFSPRLPKALPTPAATSITGVLPATGALPALQLPGRQPAGQFPNTPLALPRALPAVGGTGEPARQSTLPWPPLPESGQMPTGSFPSLPRSLPGGSKELASIPAQSPALPRALPAPDSSGARVPSPAFPKLGLPATERLPSGPVADISSVTAHAWPTVAGSIAPALPRALPGSTSPIADHPGTGRSEGTSGLGDLVGTLAKTVAGLKELIGKMGEQKGNGQERSGLQGAQFLPPLHVPPGPRWRGGNG